MNLPTVKNAKSTGTVPTILDVIVIGGGLSGLVVAHGLIGWQQQQHSWMLLEASDRLGGRLRNASPTLPIDMGGAWIWPDHQPHIRDLTCKTLQLTTFTQPDDPYSTRIDGGAVRLVEELANQINNATASSSCSSSTICTTGSSDPESNSVVRSKVTNRIVLNTPITSCTLLLNNDHSPGQNNEDHDTTLVQLETSSGELFLSRQVVFAVPPKIISETIVFDPPLSEAKVTAMAKSTTWMAGVTKVALLYPNKFWTSDTSNSGLPASTGPAFQVYDSSTKDHSLAALTLFVHVPPDDEAAQSDDAVLATQVAGQLAKLWKYYGKQSEYYNQALSYSSYHVCRWPRNRFVSGDETRPTHIQPHPTPNRALSTPEWDHRLHFCGTETDLTAPGVMEGAVSAAKRVLKSLLE